MLVWFVSFFLFGQLNLDKELRTDVVLPLVSPRVMVKNPNISFDNRFYLGFALSSLFTEPIFTPYRGILEIGYFRNERWGFRFELGWWPKGLNTQYTSGLSKQSVPPYEFERVPAPSFLYWASLDFQPYYGKISVAKNTVKNLTMFVSLGAGITQFPHKMLPGVNVSIGKRIFLTKQLFLKAEARFFYLGLVDPFLPGRLKQGQPPVDPKEFDDFFRLAQSIDVGLSWVF